MTEYKRALDYFLPYVENGRAMAMQFINHVYMSYFQDVLDNTIQQMKRIKLHACNACCALKVPCTTLTTSKG